MMPIAYIIQLGKCTILIFTEDQLIEASKRFILTLKFLFFGLFILLWSVIFDPVIFLINLFKVPIHDQLYECHEKSRNLTVKSFALLEENCDEIISELELKNMNKEDGNCT